MQRHRPVSGIRMWRSGEEWVNLFALGAQQQRNQRKRKRRADWKNRAQSRCGVDLLKLHGRTIAQDWKSLKGTANNSFVGRIVSSRGARKVSISRQVISALIQAVYCHLLRRQQRALGTATCASHAITTRRSRTPDRSRTPQILPWAGASASDQRKPPTSRAP